MGRELTPAEERVLEAAWRCAWADARARQARTRPVRWKRKTEAARLARLLRRAVRALAAHEEGTHGD